jgi:type VI secretion system protein ImpJ
MTDHGGVHWEEGLFLQQHHLQWMQRQGELARWRERRLANPYPYGVLESSLNADDMSNMLIRFDRLRAVMPSGLVVDAPNSAELPPRDVSKALSAKPMTVMLGVPLWYSTRANTVDGGDEADWRVRRLFRVSEIEAHDENTGDGPVMMRVRKINARLVLEGEDTTDLEVLPVARIAAGAGADMGVPRAVPAFSAPALVLRGSGVLMNMVRDLSNAVESSRRELREQMIRGGFSMETMRGAQVEQMMRLRTLNRAAARLPHLIETQTLTPFEAYLELRELLGELAALQPTKDLADAPGYDHDAPYVVFADLTDRVRGLLRGSVAASFVKVDFVKEGAVYAANLVPDHFTKAREYFLGVRSSMDAVALAKLVTDEDKFKLMPASQLGRAVRGVKLVEERHPPMQLPLDAKLQYFRLLTGESTRAWSRVETDGRLTAQWPESELSDLQLTLYMPSVDG